MADLSESFSSWWDELVAAKSDYRLVVVGPRKSGKSEWFRRLARESQRYRYWSALSLARSNDASVVWRKFFRSIDVSFSDEDDPYAVLDELLCAEGDDLIVVVDDWDLSLNSGGAFGEGCYEVLDSLARYSIDQPANVNPKGRRLGLILLTSLLDVVDLQEFVRTVRRPAFERLSGLIAREFRVARIPFLTHGDSESVLRECGCVGDDFESRAWGIGGWLWLLVEGSSLPIRGQEFAEVVAAAVQESTHRAIARRPSVVASGVSPAAYVAREIGLGSKRPELLGLPSDYGDENQPAPVLLTYLGRSVLFLDVENVRMPFQREAESAGLPVAEHLRQTLIPAVERWMTETTRLHDVAPSDIYLVGRSAERIDESVGRSLPGHRLFLPDALREKRERRGGDSSDDALLVAVAAKMRAENPLTRFIVMTGDMDIPLILRRANADDRMMIRAPWNVSHALRDVYSPDTLETRTFPLAQPLLAGRGRR